MHSPSQALALRVQVPLARHCLWMLLELWYASQACSWQGEWTVLSTMAGETLSNLAGHKSNGTLVSAAHCNLQWLALAVRYLTNHAAYCLFV